MDPLRRPHLNGTQRHPCRYECNPCSFDEFNGNELHSECHQWRWCFGHLDPQQRNHGIGHHRKRHLQHHLCRTWNLWHCHADRVRIQQDYLHRYHSNHARWHTAIYRQCLGQPEHWRHRHWRWNLQPRSVVHSDCHT